VKRFLRRVLLAILGFWLIVTAASLGYNAFTGGTAAPPPGLKFVEADYAWVTRELMAVADRHAQGRIVSMLEGGYALSALGRSATEHVRELLAG